MKTFVETLVDYAIKELENIKSGEIFMVRDIWKGYEWNRFGKAERLLVGRLFHDKVMAQNPPTVKKIEKSPSKQQRYIKI